MFNSLDSEWFRSHLRLDVEEYTPVVVMQPRRETFTDGEGGHELIASECCLIVGDGFLLLVHHVVLDGG